MEVSKGHWFKDSDQMASSISLKQEEPCATHEFSELERASRDYNLLRASTPTYIYIYIFIHLLSTFGSHTAFTVTHPNPNSLGYDKNYKCAVNIIHYVGVTFICIPTLL